MQLIANPHITTHKGERKVENSKKKNFKYEGGIKSYVEYLNKKKAVEFMQSVQKGETKVESVPLTEEATCLSFRSTHPFCTWNRYIWKRPTPVFRK